MMHVVVTTPGGIVYESEARELTVETTDGQVTILKNHTPLVSVLRPGEMIVRKDGDENHAFAVSGGIVEVREGGEVVVLADRAERGDEIDMEAAEASRTRVEKELEDKEKLDDIAIVRLEAELAHNLVQLRLGGRLKQ